MISPEESCEEYLDEHLMELGQVDIEPQEVVLKHDKSKKLKKGPKMPLESLKVIVAEFMNTPDGQLLWHKGLKAHSDQLSVAASWRKLAAQTGEECEVLKSVWRSLKDAYRHRSIKAIYVLALPVFSSERYRARTLNTIRDASEKLLILVVRIDFACH